MPYAYSCESTTPSHQPHRDLRVSVEAVAVSNDLHSCSRPQASFCLEKGFFCNASRLNGYHHGPNPGNGNTSPTEKNEFDDLISALRTGDVFGESVDKFTQKRWSSTRGHHSERFHGISSSGKVRHSLPRVDRTDSFLRERISSNPKNLS